VLDWFDPKPEQLIPFSLTGEIFSHQVPSSALVIDNRIAKAQEVPWQEDHSSAPNHRSISHPHTLDVAARQHTICPARTIRE
jgi:hypothetical protein